ncbi:MAG: hypothetical protein WAX69_24835 [Victivallales bacterium]
MIKILLLICSVLVFSTYSSMAQSPEKNSVLTSKEIKVLIAKLAPVPPRLKLDFKINALDRGRESALVCVPPPSEPDWRISRIRLSSWRLL